MPRIVLKAPVYVGDLACEMQMSSAAIQRALIDLEVVTPDLIEDAVVIEIGKRLGREIAIDPGDPEVVAAAWENHLEWCDELDGGNRHRDTGET